MNHKGFVLKAEIEMLKDVIEAEVCPVPNTNGRYLAYKNGTIRDLLENRTLKVDLVDGVEKIILELSQGPTSLPLAVVLCLAFKNFRIPDKYWNRLDVKVVDNYQSHLDPSNLIISMPEGGIESDTWPGFFYFPEFSDYVVSEQGCRIIRISTKKEMSVLVYKEYKSTKSMAGYHFIVAKSDLGKIKNLPLHRAKGLALLQYPSNVDKLDINHKDTIKSNNEISNLEWRTRRGNNLHATEMGLRPDNQKIIAKSIFTGEERTFFSMWECARWLGLHGDYVQRTADCMEDKPLKTRSLRSKTLPPGIMIKRNKDVEVPWPAGKELEDLLRKHYRERTRVFRLVHSKTGEHIKMCLSSYGMNKFLKEMELGDKVDTKVIVSMEDSQEVCMSLFAEKQRSYLT